MNDLLLENSEDILQSLITPEGKVIQEVLLPNPYTGEIHRIATISEVRYDPETGRPESITQQIVPVGIDGTPLGSIQDFTICSECGQPVSRVHSVIDPFCGRVLCLMHSQMIDGNNTDVRICADCANAIKRARRWEVIKGFFLERR